MASAWNAAILTDNKADTATVTATSAVSGMGAALLVSNPHVWDDQYVADANTTTISADFGAETDIGDVGLFGLNGTAAMTARLMLSSAGAGAGAGDLLDTGTLTTASKYLSDAYAMFLWREATPYSPRYLDLTLADASLTRVAAGRLAAGVSEQLAYNFFPGGTFDWTDPSPMRDTVGGQTIGRSRRKYREAALNFEWVTNAQRWGLIETLGRSVGRLKSILLMLNPDADDLPQWSAWGNLTDSTPAAFTGLTDIYGKQIKFKERR